MFDSHNSAKKDLHYFNIFNRSSRDRKMTINSYNLVIRKNNLYHCEGNYDTYLAFTNVTNVNWD